MSMRLTTDPKTGNVTLFYEDDHALVARTFTSIDGQVRELAPGNINLQVGAALSRLGPSLHASRATLAKIVLVEYRAMRAAEARRREIWSRATGTFTMTETRSATRMPQPSDALLSPDFVLRRQAAMRL